MFRLSDRSRRVALIAWFFSATLASAAYAQTARPLPQQQQDPIFLALDALQLEFVGVATYSPETGIGPHGQVHVTFTPGRAVGGACVFGIPRALRQVEPTTIVAKLKFFGVSAAIDEEKTLVPFVGDPSYVINFRYSAGRGRIFVTNNTALLTSDQWSAREVAVVYDEVTEDHHH